MSDPQPWWAKPGGATPAPGSTPQQSAPGGGQSYWNPNPSNPPPAQANPYGAPQQPYRPQQPYGATQPYGAPQQSYGAPQQSYGAQPNPWQGYNQPTNQPQYPPPTPPTKSSNNRTLLIAGLVVAAILVIGGGFAVWQFGFSGGKVLDVKQAESGVKEILSDPINGYGANDVESVNCNNGENPKVATNNSFTCKVQINGATRQVNVEFTDDNGTYAVDGPR